ncbi:MAG: hypothetical protein IPJ28_15230 [Betaproteobacteria bacterium]|nr:hypothetical protein [Betaproteobacteria bacterium]
MASMTESFNSTAVGAQALANATSAGNIALGSFAGFNITTGANNIAIGSPAGLGGDADTMRLGGGNRAPLSPACAVSRPGRPTPLRCSSTAAGSSAPPAPRDA